jgi:tape measure domain-containing protein
MGFLANLLVKIGVDNTELNGGMDKATRSVNKFATDVESAGKRLTFGLTLPIASLGLAAVKTAGEMEQTKTAFTTMMKSADLAGKHIADLKKFALTTPFQFGELTKASRLMQAYGFAADDVVPKLRTIGNAVSALGGGSEMLERVVRSMGEIGTRGKITGEQLRELSRAGIPALEAVAKKLGVSVAEAQKQITAGNVDAKTAMDGLLEYMTTRFAGGMEAQSKTVLGSWSNIKDKITFTLADIGTALLPVAKNVMSDFLDPMLDRVKALAEGFAKLPGPIQNTTLALTGLAAVLPLLTWGTGAFVGSLIQIAGAAGKVALVVKPLVPLLKGLAIPAAVGTGIYYVGNKLLEFAGKADTTANSINNLNKKFRELPSKTLAHAGPANMPSQAGVIMGAVLDSIAESAAKVIDLDKMLGDSGIKTMEQRRKDLEKAKALYSEVSKVYSAESGVVVDALKQVKEAQEALIPTAEKVKKAAGFGVPSFKFGERGFESAVIVEGLKQAEKAHDDYAAAVVKAGGLTKYNAQEAAKLAEGWKLLGNSPAIPGMGAMGDALEGVATASLPIDPQITRINEAMERLGVAGDRANINKLSEDFDVLGKGYESGAVSLERYMRAFINFVKAQDAAGEFIDPATRREVVELEKQYGGQLKATRRETRSIRHDSEDFFRSMSRGIAGAVKQWKGFGAGVKSVFSALGESVFDILFNRLMQPIEDWFTDAITSLFTKTATQAAATQAATAALNVGMVTSDAAVASAATFASISAIPIVGPAMAPAAAAAAYGQVMAMAPLAMFEKGGNVPEDMPAFLHKKEMVLPADLADGMRKIIASGNGQSESQVVFKNCNFGQNSMGQVVRQLRLAGARI